MNCRTVYKPYYANDEIICLTDAQVDYAAREGIKRDKYSVEHGHKDTKGYKPTREQSRWGHMLGAMAELAQRKYFGFPCELPSQVYRVPDMPGMIQARLISEDHYGLRITEDDEDDWVVVGTVIARGNERGFYRLPGWYDVREARAHSEWVMDPYERKHPMVAVPQDKLRPIRELLGILQLQRLAL